MSLLAAVLGRDGRGSSRGILDSLVDERLVDVRDNTTASNGSLNQGVQLLVTSDGQQQVSGCDTLDLQVLAGIAGKLQNFGSQVLHDSSGVNRSSGTDSLSRVNSSLQKTVDTTHRELKTSSGRTSLRGSLGGGGLASLASLATLAALSTFSSATEIHVEI